MVPKMNSLVIISAIFIIALFLSSYNTRFTSGAGEKLVYYSGAPQSLSAGTISAQIAVQRQNSLGFVITGPSFLVVYLHSTSSTGEFYSDPQGQNIITQLIIDVNEQSVGFYYCDATAGNPIITAYASNYASALSTFTINPSDTSSLMLTGFSASTVAGAANNITIIAKDVYGNVATNYHGTINFVSSDLYPAVLPADYQFQAADLGSHTFVNGVTFKTAGSQSITVADTVIPSITGSKTDIAVSSGALDRFFFSSIPGSQIATTPFDITITAQDAYENTVSSYSGSNALVASTGAVTPTMTGAFMNGVWSGSVTINSAGSNVVLLTSGFGCSGVSNSFDVVPALHALEYPFGALMTLVASIGALMVFKVRRLWRSCFRR